VAVNALPSVQDMHLQHISSHADSPCLVSVSSADYMQGSTIDGEKLFQATGECAKSTLSTLPKGGLAKPLDTLPWQRVPNLQHVFVSRVVFLWAVWR
jgi:hypothetical protein